MKRCLVIVALFASSCADSVAPRIAPVSSLPSLRTALADAPSTVTTEAGPLDAGRSHTCAFRRNGTVVCWSHNAYGAINVPVTESLTQLSAGFATTCGIRANGTVGCWGSDGSGQTNVPTGTFTQVSAGFYQVCGLRTDQTVTCWGSNAYRQLELPEGTYKEVSAGNERTCAVRTDGTAVCVGSTGQAPAGTYLHLSIGAGGHSCAIRSDRTLVCWGNDDYRQVSGAPTSGTFTQVSAGDYFTCALRDDGEALCWGTDGSLAQPGVAPPPSGPFVRLTAGGYHACGQRASGAIVCWGRNDVGQLNVPADLRNEAPIASAGADQTVGLDGARVASVLLDGSASSDDGNGLTYTWSAGGSAPSTDPRLSVALELGVHHFTLVVDDGEFQASDDVVITVVDPTPPVINSETSGTLGNNGWYRSDVTVHFDVRDLESDVTSEGCSDAIVTADSPGRVFTCVATSAGGDSQGTETVKRDATNPLVAFSGRLSYTVDEDVAIRCDASDELSGLAANTCAGISGPAYSFGLGQHAFSASAEDNAGNGATASGSFTVGVTAESLCTLVELWVEHSGTANSLCVKLDAARRAAERGDDGARAGQIGAFINEVEAASDKHLPADKGIILTALSRAL